MNPGDLGRFHDAVFGDPHHRYSRMMFMVIERSPPEIESMSHGVVIMIGNNVSDWSEKVLLNYSEVISESG